MDKRLNDIYELVKEKNALISDELDSVNDIILPQTYFNGVTDNLYIEVMYISDLHLDYHLNERGINVDNKNEVVAYFDRIIKKMVTDSVASFLMSSGISDSKISELILDDYRYFRYLYRCLSEEEFEEKFYGGGKDEVVTPILKRCLVFGGDLSSDINLIKIFFDRFFLRLKYYAYKDWKKELGCISEHKEGLSESDAIASYEQRLKRSIVIRNQTLEDLKKLENRIGKNIYKTYSNKDDFDAKRLIQARKDVPDYAYYILKKYKSAKSDVEYLEKNRGKIIDCSKKDYFIEFDGVFEERCPIFFVLGNHEYVNYETVDEAVKDYKTELNNYEISVIQNELLEFGNCVVYGGSAFALYNNEYNSDFLICAKKMMANRNYEIKEGKKFEEGYYKALKIAENKRIPLLVFSHYPVKDWLSSDISRWGYYFTGHTHHNTIIVGENGCIYADNQVGYKSDDFRLKRYPIGIIYNPFVEYNDGYYEVTSQQYSDFYLYNGESVRVGLIENAIKNDNKLYMVKRNGFYGFFLINNKRAQICSGGRPKNISNITSIEYFYNCFNLMVYQYVLAIKPYREIQERISCEIRKLKLPFYSSGKIHGCIVDVDFYHHIMINPFGEGTITLYYSPRFGSVQTFNSFEKLLNSIDEKNNRLLLHNNEYQENKKLFIKDKNNILSKITNNDLIGEESDLLVDVDTSSGMYGVSKRMNQLQRLFTANVLREWDNNLLGQLLGIGDIDEYVSGKKLTDYQLVQKHWKNLLRIEPDKINEKLIKCATKWNRKCRFPYLDAEKKYGEYWEINPLGSDGIKEYLEHIPKSVLKNTVMDFYPTLGKDLLKYYPLDCVSSEEMNYLLSQLSGREVVEVLEYISNYWTDSFGKCVSQKMNQKNRPSYCSKELWKKIRDYDV